MRQHTHRFPFITKYFGRSEGAADYKGAMFSLALLVADTEEHTGATYESHEYSIAGEGKGACDRTSL
eukprot:151887-Prorocentrum_minimum.AAC.1